MIDTQTTRLSLGHVLPYRSRRNADAQFHQQLVCNTLLAPQRVFAGHAPNQLAKFHRNRWASRPRLAAPEQAPACSVPSNHGLRPNHNQARAPIAQPRQPSETYPLGGIDALGLYPALLVQRELAAEYQNLDCQRPSSPDHEHDQAEKISDQPQKYLNERDHGP